MLIIKKQLIILGLLSIAFLAINSHDIATESQTLEKWFKSNRFATRKFTKLRVYVRDVFSGPIRTLQAVANSTSASPTLFGLAVVIDDPITVGPERSGSDVIGRAQGLIVFSSLEETSLHMTLHLLFTKGKYSGSTVSLVGYNPYPRELRRVPVVGGTGAFMLAQGLTLIHTVWSNSSGDAIFQYDVFISHF